jgi:hypothetical protein
MGELTFFFFLFIARKILETHTVVFEEEPWWVWRPGKVAHASNVSSVGGTGRLTMV